MLSQTDNTGRTPKTTQPTPTPKTVAVHFLSLSLSFSAYYSTTHSTPSSVAPSRRLASRITYLFASHSSFSARQSKTLITTQSPRSTHPDRTSRSNCLKIHKNTNPKQIGVSTCSCMFVFVYVVPFSGKTRARSPRIATINRTSNLRCR